MEVSPHFNEAIAEYEKRAYSDYELRAIRLELAKYAMSALLSNDKTFEAFLGQLDFEPGKFQVEDILAGAAVVQADALLNALEKMPFERTKP